MKNVRKFEAGITERVHVSAGWWWAETPALGLTVATFVAGVWPFQGYWLHVSFDLWRFSFQFYLGE